MSANTRLQAALERAEQWLAINDRPGDSFWRPVVDAARVPAALAAGDPIRASTLSISAEIARGRRRAHEKHGENSIEALDASDPRWLSILVEEIGEAAHELTYDATGDLRKELLDVLTVATAWVAAIDASIAETSCRVCGCTDEDCSQCIEKTGAPCRWVEVDLCSACADEEGESHGQ